MRQNGNGKKDNLPVIGYSPVRVELNFLRHFIFTLDDNKESDPGNIFIVTRERVYKDGRKASAKLTVYVDYEYGRCGPFDYRAFRAVEKILTDIHSINGILPEGPIKLGREYSILKLMGYKQRPSEKEYQRLKIFFTRMQRMHFHSDFATYDPIKGRWFEGGEALDPVYKKVVFTYEKMSDGTIADSVYVWLGDFYRESLNKKYIAILDWNFYSSIKNLSSRRLFEILSVYSHKYTNITLWYSDICARMQLTREKYKSDSKHQLQRIYSELIDRNFLKSVSWPDKDNTKDIRQTPEGSDWFIRFETNKNYRAQLFEQPDLIRPPQIIDASETSTYGSEIEAQNDKGDGLSEAEIVSDTEGIIFPNISDQRYYRFMKFYIRASKNISQQSYVFPKKESKEYWKIIELFDQYSETFIEKLMHQFFTTDDKYIRKQSYSVSFFLAPSVINKLITEIAQNENEAANNNKPLKDQRKIHAAKAALTDKDREEGKRMLREGLKQAGFNV